VLQAAGERSVRPLVAADVALLFVSGTAAPDSESQATILPPGASSAVMVWRSSWASCVLGQTHKGRLKPWHTLGSSHLGLWGVVWRGQVVCVSARNAIQEEVAAQGLTETVSLRHPRET
jgi:hypothetical protein